MRRKKFVCIKLPYRLVLLSTGDMGFSAEKTIDLEVWIHLKTNIVKFQAAHLVVYFNQQE